jgi:hypothetical protein
MHVCSYEIDANDRIVRVDAAWRAFAEENDASFYGDTANLYGRPLWSFVCDSTTRHIYHTIVSRVREEGMTVRVPFRCDSPRMLRWFELTIGPLPDRGVRFESRAVRTEPRAVPLFVRPGAPDSAAMLRMCSWCKDVDTTDGWQPLDRAIAQLALFTADELPQVTHGICPSCVRKFEGDWITD